MRNPLTSGQLWPFTSSPADESATSSSPTTTVLSAAAEEEEGSGNTSNRNSGNGIGHDGGGDDVCQGVEHCVSAVFDAFPGRSGVMRALELCRQTYPTVGERRFQGAIEDLRKADDLKPIPESTAAKVDSRDAAVHEVQDAMQQMRQCMRQRPDMVLRLDEEVDRVFMRETMHRK